MKLLVFSSFRDKKKTIIYTLLIILIFILSLILCINYEYYDYQINYIVGGKEINRGLVLYYDKNNIENFINNLKYIESYEPLYKESKIKNNNTTYLINSNFQKEIVYGRNIKKDNEILVSLLYLENNNLNYNDILNTNIKLTVNKNNYDFKIVGVTNDNHAHFYINNNSYERILNIKPNKYYILVNSYINVEQVINNIESKDYTVEYYDSGNLYEIEDIKIVKKKYIYLFIFLLILLMLFYKFIIKNIFNSEEKNISLYKSIGFKTKYIKNIIINKILIMLTYSYLFIFLISLIISSILNKKYLTYFIIFKYISLIYIIMIILLIFESFNMKKKIKII